MRLQRLVPAALMIASLVLIARADDPPKPDAKATPAKAEGLSKDEATIKQERLAAQFREFEQKLLRLANRYGRGRVEAACQRALAFDLLNVHRVERIVQQDLARLPAAAGERAADAASALRFLRPAQSFTHPVDRKEP